MEMQIGSEIKKKDYPFTAVITDVWIDGKFVVTPISENARFQGCLVMMEALSFHASKEELENKGWSVVRNVW